MKSQDLESSKHKYNTDNFLYTYAKNIFSQFGEDGIIEKIFSILPHRCFCSVYFSNAYMGLVVIAIASGATAVGHVNDSAFWLINRYFGMTVDETLRSWTVMVTLVGVVGFLLALFISMFL